VCAFHPSGADFSRGAIWTLQCLADLSHDEGKHGDSAQQHRESLDLCLAAENYWGIFEDVAGLLRLAIDLAMLEEAAALLVVADSLRTTFTVLPREGKWITDNQRELLERMSIKDTSARQLDPAIPEDLVEMVDIARRIATQMADRSDLVPGALPGPTGEAGADPFGLSARERDVLKLLVEGLTDRQIAEALFISHGTARTHVGHVLAKLDARNRAMAVRLAHEYRLV
jgi:DNA-binding CsgD family transcriptional regulator